MSTAQKKLFAVVGLIAAISLGIGLYLLLSFDSKVRDVIQSDDLRQMRQQVAPESSLP